MTPEWKERMVMLCGPLNWRSPNVMLYITSSLSRQVEELTIRVRTLEGDSSVRKARLVREAARRFFSAWEVMEDMSERGQDDSGKRETPAYREWLMADCEYTEALAEFKKLLRIK